MRECALLCVAAAALSVPASAQNVQKASGGLPQDWSHRHLIYANPQTLSELEASGNPDEWSRKANDPRFVGAVERTERLAAAAANGSDGNAPTLKAVAKKKGKPEKGDSLVHRDWSSVMGGASGVGAAAIFPAKYNFGVTTKDCASDFVVFTTNAAGATSSGTFWTKTGTFAGLPTVGQTVTITNALYSPSQALVLTASNSSNVGLNFLVGASATEAATNLANAIARNGGTVGVTASASGVTVTMTSITTALAAANITVAKSLSNFALAASVGGTGSKGQPTVFALNQLYADTVANGGCETATQAVPATLWAYTTGTGAIAQHVARDFALRRPDRVRPAHRHDGEPRAAQVERERVGRNDRCADGADERRGGELSHLHRAVHDGDGAQCESQRYDLVAVLRLCQRCPLRRRR